MINKDGFTLIEVLVATAVMAAVVGFGLANYARNNERQRVRQAADDLVTQLRSVQKSADVGEIPTGCVGEFEGLQVKAAIGNSIATIDALCEGGNVLGADSIFLQNGATFTAGADFIFYPLGAGISESAGVNIEVESENTNFEVTVEIQSGGAISAGPVTSP